MQRPVTMLTWQQAMAWRMRRHHLHERAPRERALEVASDVCGLHAQLMSSAELTLWARVDGLQPDAVQRMLWEERALVKTWAMRGTLHLLPAGEYPLWQSALSTYRHYLKPSWGRAFGVPAEQLEAMIAGVAAALDGRRLTREQLADAVAAHTGSAELGDKLRESWGSMLKPAAFRGRLCFAPSDGQKVRFTSPESWLGASLTEEPEHARREVARRYLAAHGPATREDLARWWAMTPAAADKLIRGLDTEEVTIEGEPYSMLAGDVAVAAASEPPRAVRLLPAFDQYVIAATKQSGLLPSAEVRPRVYRSQGWISPVLCVEGRMDGVWRHERKGKRLVVELEPFRTLPKWALAAAEAEAERLAAFLGGELEVRYSP